MTLYYEAHRRLQDRFDSRRLADRLEDVKVSPTLSDSDARFVASRDMLFLATCDPSGQPTCSIKAGEPGFVRVLDAATLLFPWYDGNGMFLSAGNISATIRIGMLFIDFEAPRRLRVEGDAELTDDPSALAYAGAQFGVRVNVRRVYPNCPRYIPRYKPVERSPYLPRTGEPPLTPDWKRADWARDVLPGRDGARGSND
jgi:hypothetical protein